MTDSKSEIPILFQNFPKAQSVNKHLKPSRTRGMVKSAEHRQYERQCQAWAFDHQRSIDLAKVILTDRKKHLESQGLPFLLSCEYYILTHKENVITAKGKVVGVDVDNFIKPIKDNIFKILDINDKHVIKDTIEKVFIKPDMKECVMIKIYSHHPRDFTDPF